MEKEEDKMVLLFVRWVLLFLLLSWLLNQFLLSGAAFGTYIAIIVSSLKNWRTTLVFLVSPLLLSLIVAACLRKIKSKYWFAGIASASALFFFGMYLFSYGFSSQPIFPSSYYWKEKGDLKKTRDFLIAHAGGMADSQIGTNSKEALDYSLSRNSKLIEFDFDFTSDHQLVCVHDWEKFYKMANIPKGNQKIPALTEFKQTVLYGKYTTLTGEDINKMMQEHPEVTLVTDKVSDFPVLKEKLPYLDRMIVEVFSPVDYLKAKSIGFKYPAYRVSSIAAVPAVYAMHAEMITAPERMIRRYPAIFKQLHEQKVTILVYSRDDERFIEQYQGTHFSLLYTNSL